jgi:hypothetical protein
MSLTGGRKSRKANRGGNILGRMAVPGFFLAALLGKKSKKHKVKKQGTRKGMRRKTARRAYSKRR